MVVIVVIVIMIVIIVAVIHDAACCRRNNQYGGSIYKMHYFVKFVSLFARILDCKINQSLHSSCWFQEVEALRFEDIRRTKVVRLSPIRTGRLYPAGNISRTYLC
jgi:hypothetical protein